MQKLFTAALVCALLSSTSGCTNQQVLTVVKDIGIYTEQAGPIVESLLPIIAALDTNGNTPDPAIAQYGTLAQTDLSLLAELCAAYTSAPSSTTYTRISSAVDALESNTDAALLAANNIVNPASRQKVLVTVASISAIVHIMDGFLQTAESPANVAAQARSRQIKLHQLTAFYSGQDRERIERAFHGLRFSVLIDEETRLGF